jgi:myb proto-oncogene protein
MAKKALSEALSPQKSTSSNNLLLPLESNISSESSFCSTKPTTQTQSLCYASSADNIARLLKGWMKNKPKGSNGNYSNVKQNSFNIDLVCSEGMEKGSSTNVEISETFESFFGYESLDSSNSDSTNIFQDESKPEIIGDGEIMPFSLLEKWLLDDGGIQEKVGLSEINYVF